MKSNFIKYIFFILVIIIVGVAIYTFYKDESNKANNQTNQNTEQTSQTLTDLRLEIVNFDNINPLISTNRNVQEITKLVEGKNTIFVYNKKDLVQNNLDDKLYVSALNKDVEPLKKAIIEKLGLSKENYDNPSIANTREIGILENIKTILEQVLIDVKSEIPIDLINSELKEAYLKTLSITGEDNDFDIAKEIFSRFCVGK